MVKPCFEAPSQNGTFGTKSAILGFPETPIFVVFGDFAWAQKRTISKTDSRNENARFFTFRTQIVFAYFSKNVILTTKTFFLHNRQKHNFLFFEAVLFHFFIFSFSLYPHKKDTNKKCTFFLFLHLDNQQKSIFAPVRTICVFLVKQGKSWADAWPDF